MRELNRLRRAAAISGGDAICGPATNMDDLPTLGQRIDKMLQLLTSSTSKNNAQMTYFVMYDIASNKVRTLVSKYLERLGLSRIQKSVFMGNTKPEVYDKIRTDLAEVQAAYENKDSIIVIPISTDMTNAMRLIGREIDVDLITKAKSTVFF